MRKVKQGDCVEVHYVKRFQDGTKVTSRGKDPLKLTVGEAHPRLPGLGLALVGRAPGETTTLTVPPEQAYGSANPKRILRWSRKRFDNSAALQVGEWVPVLNRRGARRLVRILQVHDKSVVFDANHRWAGQTMVLKVRLQTILTPAEGNPAT